MYPHFGLGCIYCGARLIQRIGLLQISQTECKQRRQAVLKDWVEYGHSETQIRAMVSGPHCTGPASPSASERPPSEKTR